MTLLSDPLTYLFWPNPGNADYSSPKVIVLLVVCGVLVAGSFAIKHWRSSQGGVTKKLTKSWSRASFWFGLIGLFLVVSRVEEISYVSMRFLWAFWLVGLLLYAGIQIKLFRSRNYTVLPKEVVDDPRSKYLPNK